MKTTQDHDDRIANMDFAKIYPLLLIGTNMEPIHLHLMAPLN